MPLSLGSQTISLSSCNGAKPQAPIRANYEPLVGLTHFCHSFLLELIRSTQQFVNFCTPSALP